MKTELPSRSGWTRTILLSIVLLVFVGVLSLVPVFREFNVGLSDGFFRVAPVPDKASTVVLVLVDDESLRAYGRWPWSRTLLAQLTRRLQQAGATAVGLDILLSEPQSPDADAALSRAMRDSNAVIVDKIGTYPDGPRWVEPLPQFSQAVSAVGHAQAVLDRDGVCRRFPLVELTPDGSRLAFAIEVARRVDSGRTTRFVQANNSLSGENQVLTVVRPRLVVVPYRRDGFETLSAASVLRGEGLARLRGRPVLVGFGPTEISDRVTTPLSRELPTPGVEVHAQILDAVLTDRQLHESPLWLSVLLLLMASMVVMALLRRWHGWKAIVCMTLSGVTVFGIAFLTFVYASLIVPVGTLLLTIVIGPLIAYAVDFLMVERSVTRQLEELRQWLRTHDARVPETRDLSWRLTLLRELQAELGSLYELYATLLEATQDAVGIFDASERLFLHNRRFDELFPSVARPLKLTEFEQVLTGRDGVSPLKLRPDGEDEVVLAGAPYSIRTAKLPPTRLTPEGGTVVTLTSLKFREERDRARGEALGFVTHELRAPLVAIQGFAELMVEYPESPACAKAPETIFRESKRLLALISSYLDVLRIDAGARPMRLERLDLNDIVRDVLDVLTPLAKAAEIVFLFESGPPVFMEGDRSLLSGAVLNLASNAIKYGKASSTVTLRCSCSGGTVAISVHNEGETIPPEQAARLFDPYYRTPEAESSRTGTGLGLAFVKRIAEKHGGAVRVESGTAGTTFEVSLPANQGAAAARGAA